MLSETYDNDKWFKNISKKAYEQYLEANGDYQPVEYRKSLQDDITLSFFKKLEPGVTIVDPYCFFMSSRVLVSWWCQSSLGPLASANNDGKRPFLLTHASRVAFGVKKVDEEGRFELMLKKATPSDQNVIYNDMINSLGVKTEEEICIVNRFRVVRSIEGGVFIQFYLYVAATIPFKEFAQDPTQDENTITWEVIRNEYMRWSFICLGKNIYMYIYS